MDQDAFNFVFKDRVKWLDVRYNAMIPQYRMHRFSQSEINRFTVWNMMMKTKCKAMRRLFILPEKAEPAPGKWSTELSEICGMLITDSLLIGIFLSTAV